MRAVHAAIWAVGTLMASAAGAWAAPAPTLTGDLTEERVDDWRIAHIRSGDEVYVDWDDASVAYFDPWTLQKLPDGHLTAVVRNEYFAPNRRPGGTARSTKQLVEFDCAGKARKILSSESYPQNNLQGRLLDHDLPASYWSEALSEETLAGVTLRQVCSLSSLVGTPDWEKAMARPPADPSDAALDAWLEEHIDLRDEVFLGHRGGAGVYYSPKDTEKLANGHYRTWIRRELPRPIGLQLSTVRSTRSHVELDCARRRYAYVDLIVFPGSNQLGTPSSDFTDDEEQDWTLATAGSEAAGWLGPICRLAADPKLSVEDARKPPAASEPKDDSVEALRAWAKTRLNTNNFTYAATAGDSLYFYGTEGVSRLPNGNLTAWMRTETPKAEEGRQRSSLTRTEFDCRGGRMRSLSIQGFASNDLEEEIGATSQPAPWTASLTNESVGGQVLRQVCNLQSLVGADVDMAAALIPPPATIDEDGVARWLVDYVDMEGYAPATYTDSAAILYSTKEAERRGEDYVRVYVRQEFFEPIDGMVRSIRMLMDFDCAEGRERTLSYAAYPGSNLLGSPIERKGEAEWSFTAPRSGTSYVSAELCAVNERADESVSEPRLPVRETKTPL
jgi:hypothetical protein